jgi:uncharacterized protein (TIGR03435 family)
MTDFAQMLSNQMGRTVIDKTGLTGDYDFMRFLSMWRVAC